MLSPVKARAGPAGLDGVEPGRDPTGSPSGAIGVAPVTTPGAERVAPPAGLAVRISGTTHAAAPAVANSDTRPSACRLESEFLAWAARGAPAPSCESSLCIVPPFPTFA